MQEVQFILSFQLQPLIITDNRGLNSKLNYREIDKQVKQ